MEVPTLSEVGVLPRIGTPRMDTPLPAALASGEEHRYQREHQAEPCEFPCRRDQLPRRAQDLQDTRRAHQGPGIRERPRDRGDKVTPRPSGQAGRPRPVRPARRTAPAMQKHHQTGHEIQPPPVAARTSRWQRWQHGARGRIPPMDHLQQLPRRASESLDLRPEVWEPTRREAAGGILHEVGCTAVVEPHLLGTLNDHRPVSRRPALSRRCRRRYEPEADLPSATSHRHAEGPPKARRAAATSSCSGWRPRGPSPCGRPAHPPSRPWSRPG